MSLAVAALDAWLRGPFVAHNTALEAAYDRGAALTADQAPDRATVTRARALMREGAALAAAIDRLPARPDDRYELLGMVGYVLGACRRHDVEDAAVLAPAWALAQRLGDDLGVAPRFVFAHQSLANTARAGRFRTFTADPEEAAFIEFNALGVLAYGRAAAALRQVPAMGVSNPMSGYLLDVARASLDDVIAFSRRLAKEVTVDRFFRTIRPYFRTHRVGEGVHRGVNAGDFAAINVLDVLLGAADPRDPFYAAIVAEKVPYVPPTDQPALRAIGELPSLLAAFISEAEAEATAGPSGPSPQLHANAVRFLAVRRAHGAASTFHHHALVRPFLERPAAAAPADRAADLSASGPPLPEVIATLARLQRLRADTSPTERLRALLDPTAMA